GCHQGSARGPADARFAGDAGARAETHFDDAGKTARDPPRCAVAQATARSKRGERVARRGQPGWTTATHQHTIRRRTAWPGHGRRRLAFWPVVVVSRLSSPRRHAAWGFP